MSDANIRTATERAIELAGGAREVSEQTGWPLSTVYHWLKRGYVTAEDGQVLQLEGMTNHRITRYQLRPDVYGELT